MHDEGSAKIRGTTIVAVKKNGEVAIAGDGQVSIGNTCIKATAKKVKKIYNNKVIVGFAGSTSDAITLSDRLETKLESFEGNLKRSAVELAKDWRTDKYLRRLDAMLLTASTESIFILSGSGDVIEPEEGLAAIGSGGNYALAAAMALSETPKLTASEVATKAIMVAAKICVFTNSNITTESLAIPAQPKSGKSSKEERPAKQNKKS